MFRSMRDLEKLHWSSRRSNNIIVHCIQDVTDCKTRHDFMFYQEIKTWGSVYDTIIDYETHPKFQDDKNVTKCVSQYQWNREPCWPRLHRKWFAWVYHLFNPDSSYYHVKQGGCIVHVRDSTEGRFSPRTLVKAYGAHCEMWVSTDLIHWSSR